MSFVIRILIKIDWPFGIFIVLYSGIIGIYELKINNRNITIVNNYGPSEEPRDPVSLPESDPCVEKKKKK